MVPIFTVNIQPCSNKNRISATSDQRSYQVWVRKCEHHDNVCARYLVMTDAE